MHLFLCSCVILASRMALLQSASGIRSMLGLQAARALSHSLASTSVCSSFHSGDAAPSSLPAEPLYEGARPLEETMGTGLLWGRGDKRTWRGKVTSGISGVVILMCNTMFGVEASGVHTAPSC